MASFHKANIWSEDHYFVSESRIIEIFDKYNVNDEEKDDADVRILYWKKTFQQLFDDDKKYRIIINNALDKLGPELDEFKKSFRIAICNKTDTKIGFSLS